MSSNMLADPTTSIESQSRERDQPGILGWAIVLGFCALLIFAILAFGAVDEWSTFTFEAGAALLFLLWAAKQLLSQQVRLSNNPLYLPTGLFFGLILAQILLRRSAYGYVTKYEALQYVSYGMMLFIAAECLTAESSRKRFAQIMSIFGFAYALFAVVQALTPNGKIFWIHTSHFPSATVFGSYVNHNHFAGVMEMLTPIPFVVSMGHLLQGGKRALAGFCAGVMATTIFLSGSRGGMIAFICQSVVFMALAFGKKRSPRLAMGSVAVCVFILALLFFLDQGQALAHLGDLNPDIRLDITKDSLKMFSHRPVLGWGLGTFPTIYPRYRSFYTNLFINEAHNDYAQLLVEMGTLGFVLMLWFLVSLYRHGLPTSRSWEFRWDWGVSLAALLGCTGILVHSFVDFNLQITANAALFYSLCGLAASKPLETVSRRKRSRSIQEEESAARRHLSDHGEPLEWSK
ncbi:MAG TPA: O-antigen ligase family protein [Candidatus Sulfotelmatobacter sp.]|nr:O-antigen ligase family protein [Candidatus Sulfotelmatobacter sp.]